MNQAVLEYVASVECATGVARCTLPVNEFSGPSANVSVEDFYL
jgi:hypothetical protein